MKISRVDRSWIIGERRIVTLREERGEAGSFGGLTRGGLRSLLLLDLNFDFVGCFALG